MLINGWNFKLLQVEVEIVDDNQWEPDEEFFLKLSLVASEDNSNVQLGHMSIMEITILNDDGELQLIFFFNISLIFLKYFTEPGLLSFHKRGILVKESIGMARIPIVRSGGADGEVSVMWRTKDKSAVGGKDYVGGEGTITFKHTEVSRFIFCKNNFDLHRDFFLIIFF